ncbi:YbaB/EbfC family nucleoid-associated protein [Anaerofustis butyriciformans]|uniref:YbaB/EbfC family nucleoid-associated protein n=1 Tax=Anaerofustis TaxID=264995 RepID=UPI003F8C8717
MAKGRMNGFGGGAGMSGMMKQMQKMQADMQKMQKELEESTYEATSGGGAVKAVVTGEKLVESIEIDPDMLKEEDADIICDMVVAAVNEAINKASEDANNKMGSIAGGLGGLNIPGL